MTSLPGMQLERLDPATVPPASRELRAIAESMGGNHSRHTDKRRYARHTYVTDVLVRQITAEGEVVGEPFTAIATDLSTNGLSLLHETRIDSQLVCVQLRMAGNDWPLLLLRVLRQRSLKGAVQIAGEFLRRV